MQATIEGIEQFLRLDGKYKMVNSLRIKLPDGTVFTANVDNSVIEKIISLSKPDEDQSLEPGEQPAEDGVFGGDLLSVPEEEQLIDWAALPDSTLPEVIKQELRKLSFPSVARASELAEMVDKVSEQMMVRAQRAQVSEEARAIKNTLKDFGQPMQVVRPRTVPKDELGYPIVPKKPSDPGEVALAGDEDGVPQL